MYIGSWKLEDYLTFSCTTHAATSGKLTDADGLPNFRVYEDAVGTVMLNGSMPFLDQANTTGFYNKRIQITAASSFEKGKSYTIYKEGTVGTRKAALEDHFQIEAEVDANVVSAVGLNVRTGTLNYVGTVNILNDKTGYTVSTVSDKTGYRLSATGVDDILDEVVEGSLTMRHMLRIFLSRLAGKASGGGTTSITFRDNADGKNRITMTVNSDGNRSAVTVDGT